jgi:hypothetical protein
MSAKRRTRVEPGIYRRPDGRLEIGYRDATGKQRWRVVDGGIKLARKRPPPPGPSATSASTPPTRG